MKELSIEEKAKAYDGVREKIAIRFGYNVAEEIFSQFEMSEDERIRKELIEFVKSRGGFKQEYIAWLEKQGEQKPAEKYDITGIGSKNAQGKLGEMIKNLKPADKDEPKFHEGEWIVKNDDSLINIDYSCCKITKVENGNYTIESIYGYKGYNTFETFEKDYHLWTIKDAKDGDILVGGEQLFLFKRINTSNSFYAHCNYHFIGHDSLSFYDCSYSIDNIHPATKEQRDTLIKAMTDAGYIFDFEKKELKKIEKNLDWTEEDEKNLNEALSYIKDETLKNFIKNRVQPQAKQEWSEKDKCMLNNVIDTLKPLSQTTHSGYAINSMINWLKSLRPQNWTKEDKERYISCLQRLSTGNPEQSETINSKWFKEHVYPQSQWKPSEEQIKALSYYLKNDIDNDGVFGCQLVKLYQDLKKLREE